MTYLAMHTKAPRHLSIHTDMHVCRGDLYTQLFLICTWLLLFWLIFEKKGRVIRNFHSSKHKRVQLVSEGSRFFSDVFRKSVNGRNIVQQSRKVKTLSFFCEKEFCFNFGETIFIFCEKDFCTIWILWTGFVTGELSFWYNFGFFWLCLFISTMFQIAHEIRIEAYKPHSIKIWLCWVLILFKYCIYQA
jgi:hypothetical protein